MNYRRLLSGCVHGFLFVGVLSGCWRRIEYADADKASPGATQAPTAGATTTTPPSAAEPMGAAASDAEADSGNFGDELPTMLSSEAPEPTRASETGGADGSLSHSASVVGDRYATAPPPAAEPSIFDEPPAESGPAEAAVSDAQQTEASAAPETAASTTSDSVASLFAEPVESNAPPGSPVDDAMLPEQREAIAETSDAIIPDLNDDEIPQPPAVAAWNTRRAAWLLGSKLSLAALANDYGGSSAKVNAYFTQARDLAVTTLELVAPGDLPSRPAGGKDPAAEAGLDYLFAQGQKIGRELAAGQGVDHAALFEIAVKSNILLVLYTPGAATSQAIAKAIEQAGTRAKLPAALWQPVVDAINAKASLAEVRSAVYQMHGEVDKYLDQPPQ